MGNHVVAYRTSSDKYGSSLEGEYLAIHDLTGNKILYLPDVYEEVYNMAIEENESTVWEGRTYEITFTRTSPVYLDSGSVMWTKMEMYYTPWFDEESIWSRYNKENSTLYPGHPATEWGTIEVMIGEDTIHKYVREQ